MWKYYIFLFFALCIAGCILLSIPAQRKESKEQAQIKRDEMDIAGNVQRGTEKEKGAAKYRIRKLLDSYTPAETLCEGDQCADDFQRYRHAITEQIGSPYAIHYGKPPFNDGAVYIYWKYGNHRIDLSYRAVSAHYRNQGHRPFIEYVKRGWEEPPGN